LPWGARDFMTALKDWAQGVSCAHKMLHMLPPHRFIELRYEDLVADPDKELRRLTDFLQLDFEPDMVRRHTSTAQTKVILKNIHTNLREPASASHAFKWMKTLKPADQAVAFEIAGPVLADFGYPEGRASHPFKILRKCYHRLKEAYEWRIRGRPGSTVSDSVSKD
jgi:Sulfotransferase family